MDQVDENADAPYLVPTHLREPQSIGPIPVRAFFVVLVAGLLLGVPTATFAADAIGEGGYWFVLVPIALAIPFALPWLDPPAEHGYAKCLSHWVRVVLRNVSWTRLPPRRELLEADGLRALLGVLNAYR